MKKLLVTSSLLLVFALYSGDKLKINKPDGSSQMYELATVNELNFSDPGNAKLKIIKPDGSELLYNLSDIIKLTLSELNDIEKADVLKKLGISLAGNYPNPFNPSTTIDFTTGNSGLAKVEVFNQAGQLVSTLHDGLLTAGNHSMQWNARNVSAGTYFVRVSQNGKTVSNRMLLLK